MTDVSTLPPGFARRSRAAMLAARMRGPVPLGALDVPRTIRVLVIYDHTCHSPEGCPDQRHERLIPGWQDVLDDLAEREDLEREARRVDRAREIVEEERALLARKAAEQLAIHNKSDKCRKGDHCFAAHCQTLCGPVTTGAGGRQCRPCKNEAKREARRARR